jgi:hypothetical protein
MFVPDVIAKGKDVYRDISMLWMRTISIPWVHVASREILCHERRPER